MERRFQDPVWWNARAVTYGHTAESADYSIKSHAKRLKAFGAVAVDLVDLKKARIFDLPCGTGMLRQALSVLPEAYTGADFSTEALAICKQSMSGRLHSNYVQLDLRESTWPTQLPASAPYDLIICCGLFCFAELFNDEVNAITFIERALTLGKTVIANFPRDDEQAPYQGDIRCYRLSTIIKASQRAGITCRLEYGYLPHEFLGVFHL